MSCDGGGGGEGMSLRKMTGARKRRWR